MTANNIEDVKEEETIVIADVTDKIETEEETVKTAESQLEDLKDLVTGMTGEDILNLTPEKKNKITGDIKKVVNKVYQDMRDKASEKLGVMTGIEETIIAAARETLVVIDGKSTWENVEKIINDNKENLVTVLGEKAPEDILTELKKDVGDIPENSTPIIFNKSKWKIQKIIDTHDARRKTLAESYMDTNDFATFLEDEFYECLSINSDLRKYNLFKNRVKKFLNKKVSGTKEAIAWHSVYQNKFIGPAAKRVHVAYIRNVAQENVGETNEVNVAVSIVTIALFRYVMKLFNFNTLHKVQRQRLISAIFIDTPELESMKYAAVVACLERMHEDYLNWKKENNIPDELEEAGDDISEVTGQSANVYESIEDVKPLGMSNDHIQLDDESHPTEDVYENA